MKYILVESDFIYGHKVKSPFYVKYEEAVNESIAILEASFPTDHLKINEIRKDFIGKEPTIVNDEEYYIMDVDHIFTEYHPEYMVGCENYFAVCAIDNGEVQKPCTSLCFSMDDAIKEFQKCCSSDIEKQLSSNWVVNLEGREYHLVHIVREMC